MLYDMHMLIAFLECFHDITQDILDITYFVRNLHILLTLTPSRSRLQMVAVS